MRKILESCPTCGGEFAVTELTCTVCDTVVRSQYDPCPFCRLAPEDLAFMLVFVRNRGNVKEMERELGVSYWTIRGRLTEVITSMGLEPGGELEETTERSSPNPDERRATNEERRMKNAARQTVLERLRRGELTAEEAADELRIAN
jgi:hypothetical protein